MKILKKSLLYIVPVLLLCSCGSPVSVPMDKTKAPSAYASASSLPSASPSPSATKVPPEPSVSAEGISISPDKDGYTIIPGSLPDLSAADIKKFDPGKVYAYLAKDSCITDSDYWYTLNSVQVTDGKLELSISVNISFTDINTAYQDLKIKHSLSDSAILRMPLFKGCVIQGGVLYASKDALKDRQQYKSYKDWQDDNGGFANCPDGVYTEALASPVPVADNTDIVLFDFNVKDPGEYSRVTIQQFKDFVLDPNNVNDYGGSVYILDNLYFKYSGGYLAAVFQGSAD